MITVGELITRFCRIFYPEHFPFEERRPVKSSDNRQICRYPAAKNRTSLGWWKGETWIEADAQILDIGAGGALILTQGLPPCLEVHFRLVEPRETGWCPTRISWLRQDAAGSVWCGLEFEETCGYELFKILTYGAGVHERPAHISTEFSGRYWK